MLAFIVPIEGRGMGGYPEHPIYNPPGIWPTPPPVEIWPPPPPGHPSHQPIPPYPPTMPANPIALPPDQIYPPLPPGSTFPGQWVLIYAPGSGYEWVYLNLGSPKK